VRGRKVLWDEHYHGHARSLWSYAAGTPVGWGLAQLGLIAGVVLFTLGRYVGPPRSAAVVPRTSPLEFVETLGQLYETAGQAGAAIATARGHVRRLLLERAGIPASSSDARLASALAARFGMNDAEVRSILERSEPAGPGTPVKDADAVALVQQLQHLAAAASAPDRRSGADRTTKGIN
jgi:hypothetical protein